MACDDGAFASFAARSRRCLPRLFADYVDRGAHGEWTMARNRSAFRQWGIVPRGLRDVSRVNTAVSCFGQTWKTPLMLAPVGFAGMLHSDREVGGARAAGNAVWGWRFPPFPLIPWKTWRLQVRRHLRRSMSFAIAP